MRTAIVTGGAAGIGLASAKRLLEDGWRVVALDRDTQALKESSGILAPFGESVRFEALDVTDEPAVTALVLKTTREFGPLRGLITSAGIASNTALFDTSPDLMRRMNEVNVIGTFVIAKAAAQAMRESGGGAIVTIASVSGLVGNRGRTAEAIHPQGRLVPQDPTEEPASAMLANLKATPSTATPAKRGRRS